MDPIRNPFAPGAGNQPPELAGRSEIIDSATVALRRTFQKRSSNSQILVGLRGVGKTVLLNRIQIIGEKEGLKIIYIEAHEDRSLSDMLIPHLRQLLNSISTIAKARHTVRTAFRVLSSFVRSVRISHPDSGLEFNYDVEPGVADSGDLELDLPQLLMSVAEAADDAGIAVAIIIDELQYLKSSEFSALIMSMHRISQKTMPVILFGAGLPQILALAGSSKSYSERLFRFPDIGPLSNEAAVNAIRRPVEQEGERIEQAAVEQIITVTEGYPYFLQQWAHDSWNAAAEGLIRKQDVINAHANAIAELDSGFFKVRFDRCTPAERRYMRALAELGSGSHRSGEVADKLEVKVTSVAPVRSTLIRKGMIYSKQHGDIEFTVPLFHEYMRRVMPKLKKV